MTCPRARRLAWGAALCALVAAVPEQGSAQAPAQPRVEGVVERGAGGPLAEASVVLHRVDPVEAGEIDSVRSDARGRFAFDLPTVPDPGGRSEVYFASVRHDGVVYFGPPLARAVELDSVYRIQVYDTATAPPGGAPVPLGVRYLLAEAVEGGWEVTDLLQLDAIGERTWVQGAGGITWRYPMPSGIGEVEMGGGDLPVELTRFPEGAVEFTGPLSPGPRQLVLRYRLDSLALTIPLPGGVREMELLIQEPAPPVQVTGLAPAESVEMEPGVRYRRYAAADLSGAVVQVVEGEGETPLPLEWLAVLLGLGLAVAGLVAVQRGRTPATVASAPGERGSGLTTPPSTPDPAAVSPVTDPAVPWVTAQDRRRRLVLEIARIDEAMEGEGGVDRERLEARREELLSLLQEPAGEEV